MAACERCGGQDQGAGECPLCGNTLIGELMPDGSCRSGLSQDVVAGIVRERAQALAKVERLRDALIPFASIGRAFMEPLGLAAEYDEARRLLGLPHAPHKEYEGNP